MDPQSKDDLNKVRQRDQFKVSVEDCEDSASSHTQTANEPLGNLQHHHLTSDETHSRKIRHRDKRTTTAGVISEGARRPRETARRYRRSDSKQRLGVREEEEADPPPFERARHRRRTSRSLAKDSIREDSPPSRLCAELEHGERSSNAKRITRAKGDNTTKLPREAAKAHPKPPPLLPPSPDSTGESSVSKKAAKLLVPVKVEVMQYRWWVIAAYLWILYGLILFATPALNSPLSMFVRRLYGRVRLCHAWVLEWEILLAAWTRPIWLPVRQKLLCWAHEWRTSSRSTTTAEGGPRPWSWSWLQMWDSISQYLSTFLDTSEPWTAAFVTVAPQQQGASSLKIWDTFWVQNLVFYLFFAFLAVLGVLASFFVLKHAVQTTAWIAGAIRKFVTPTGIPCREETIEYLLPVKGMEMFLSWTGSGGKAGTA